MPCTVEPTLPGSSEALEHTGFVTVWHSIWYSWIWYSVGTVGFVQLDLVQYWYSWIGTAEFGTVWYSIWYSWNWYRIGTVGLVQLDLVQCGTVGCGTVGFGTIRYNIWYGWICTVGFVQLGLVGMLLEGIPKILMDRDLFFNVMQKPMEI